MFLTERGRQKTGGDSSEEKENSSIFMRRSHCGCRTCRLRRHKAPAEVQTADVTEGENVTAGASEATAEAAADSVIVTMPTTSEPEAGFNPVYGWGAGEHVHEPLIQSTLTTTTADLKIGKDLATDYSVSEDGLTWTVSIRDDVKFTDGEPLTASDVAFTYNLCVENSSVNDFTMLKEAVAVDDTTVEFHMNTPFSIWPYTMAIVGIIPEHAYDENYGRIPSVPGVIS